METRLKTGIEGLDKLLEGGFPSDSSILLIGPPGCGKSTMCQQFVWEGLKSKQPAMYVTFDISPKEVLESMKNFGWSPEKFKEKLKFIDAYSWRLGKSGEEYAIENIGDVNELNIAISEVIKALDSAPTKREVFDSISTFLLYADPALVVRLIPVLIAKGREAHYTELLVLEEGVHDEKTISTLNFVTDGLIEFKMEGDKRLLRIVRMKATKHYRDWAEFEITDKGMRMKNV